MAAAATAHFLADCPQFAPGQDSRRQGKHLPILQRDVLQIHFRQGGHHPAEQMMVVRLEVSPFQPALSEQVHQFVPGPRRRVVRFQGRETVHRGDRQGHRAQRDHLPPAEGASGMKARHPQPRRQLLEVVALLVMVVAVWAVLLPLLPFLIAVVGALAPIAAVALLVRYVVRQRRR